MTEEICDVETIPDSDVLYYRVNATQLKDNNELHAGVFRERPSEGCGMSTCWSKHSTAENCRLEAESPPEQNGIIELSVDAVRGIKNLAVIHDPKPNRCAHSLVNGMNDPPQGVSKNQHKTDVRNHLFYHFNTWHTVPPILEEC